MEDNPNKTKQTEEGMTKRNGGERQTRREREKNVKETNELMAELNDTNEGIKC